MWQLNTDVQPWYWRSLPLGDRTGADVFATLFRPNPTAIATLLESPSHTLTTAVNSRYSICAGSPRVINGHLQMWTPPVGQILPFLKNLLLRTSQNNQNPQSETSTPPRLPFTGGWLGWLGYDLAWEIEQLPQLKSDPLPFPVAFWYEPECFAVLDHASQILWLAASHVGDLDRLQQQLEFGREGVREWGSRGLGENIRNSSSLIFHTNQEDYLTSVNRVKKYIRAGDIFQANISLRFEAQTAASGWEIYRTLHSINPSPFASYWQTPWGEVISCSPERLVQLQNGQAQTRPIAGTRSRGLTTAQDHQLASELCANIKERAEHIMLVDLERNDLGRVCEWGSVVVDELLTIERYSHVMHLVSNITGNLRSDRLGVDLIRAVFPGGTITGCPKVRCMEIIEELEPMRRSLFYGSCGYYDQRGNLDLNILIRTLLFPKTELTIFGQVGAGIVADSDPEREWEESLSKAQAQLAALQGTWR